MDQRPNFWFHDTVSALVSSLAGTRAEPDRSDLQPPYNDLTQFVLDQHHRLAGYLRAPLLGVTLGFDLLGVLRNRGLFHRLPPAVRAHQINAWKNSSVAFKRDLVRYFESLAILALYSREEKSDRNDLAGTQPISTAVLTEPARELSAEIVVVGSGPGGAITACLLAEAGRNVLLIEEGPYLSLDSCEPFTRTEMMRKYRNGGQTVAMGAHKIAYVEGRCAGGGSEINSGLYHRTPPEILESWHKEFQVDGISENDLRPHFEACEKDLSVSALRGNLPPPSQRLRDGAARLGWKSLEVPRWFRYADGGTAGRRQSMTETFIPRFLKSGGKLLPRTRAQSIREEHGRWTVHAHHDAFGALRITAGTLFICGGAVQTPTLLRRSGIRRNIGNSLRLHPTVKLVAKFPDTVNSEELGVPAHQIKEFAPRLSFGCSVSTPPYLALALLDHPSKAREVSSDWRRMAVYYAMITGQGHGTVRPIPGCRDPLVRFRLGDSDRRDLADGLRKLSEALFASGAEAIYPSVTGGPELLTADDLKKVPDVLPSGMANMMTIHLFSSCPMGEDKSRCAADSYGRVHGFKNLYVADASLLCTAPGVNPQGSIMALARRNALNFLSGK